MDESHAKILIAEKNLLDYLEQHPGDVVANIGVIEAQKAHALNSIVDALLEIKESLGNLPG